MCLKVLSQAGECFGFSQHVAKKKARTKQTGSFLAAQSEQRLLSEAYKMYSYAILQMTLLSWESSQLSGNFHYL